MDTPLNNYNYNLQNSKDSTSGSNNKSMLRVILSQLADKSRFK
jgi:hypothetical protein